MHENGNRHKTAVREHLIHQKKKKAEEKSEQIFRDATLAQIERDARAAMEEQLQGDATTIDTIPAISPSAPIPPTTIVAVPTYVHGRSAASEGVVYAREAKADYISFPPVPHAAAVGAATMSLPFPPPPPIAPTQIPEESVPSSDAEPSIMDTDGTYQIRGQYYMTGEHPYAQELYVPGAEIEAQKAGSSGWYHAKIISVDRIKVPNTDVVIFKFNVVYRGSVKRGVEPPDSLSLASLDPSCFDIVTIPPSMTRFPILEATAETFQRRFLEKDMEKSERDTSAAESEIVSLRPIDEVTGLGMWQVVDQPSVPEEEKAAPGDKRGRGVDDLDINELDEDISKALTKYARKKAAAGASLSGKFEEYDDNPLYVYRPGLSKDMRGTYRGIALRDDETEAFEASAAAPHQTLQPGMRTLPVVSIVPEISHISEPTSEEKDLSPVVSITSPAPSESVPPVHVVHVTQSIPDVVVPPRRNVKKNNIRRRELD